MKFSELPDGELLDGELPNGEHSERRTSKRQTSAARNAVRERPEFFVQPCVCVCADLVCGTSVALAVCVCQYQVCHKMSDGV